MDIPLKFLFCFFLASAVMGQFETEYDIDPHENTRQFIQEENGLMIKLLQEEMLKMFAKMTEKFDQKLTRLDSKMEKSLKDLSIVKVELEKHQEELSANLSLEFNRNMDNLYQNLSKSCTQNVANSNSMIESSLRNLSASVAQKLDSSNSMVETSFRNISDSFDKKLLQSESKATGELKETLRRNLQIISHSISYLTTSLLPTPNLTEVEEVNTDNGTIEFTAGRNCLLRRKIWVLQSKGGNSYRSMNFLVEENRLGEDARISLWGSNSGHEQTFTGFQNGSKKERTTAGHVIVVTLTISPGGTQPPSFKLKFNTSSTRSHLEYSSEILHKLGTQVVSFPTNNTEDYPVKWDFVAVVASPRGESLGLFLKHLDIPGTPPDCRDNQNYLYMWFLEESPNGHSYNQLTSSEYANGRRSNEPWCGRVGAVSEPLGNTTVAILRFRSWGGSVGKGFRVEVN